MTDVATDKANLKMKISLCIAGIGRKDLPCDSIGGVLITQLDDTSSSDWRTSSESHGNLTCMPACEGNE